MSSDSDSSLAANVFGVVGFVISLAALARCRGHLPQARVRILAEELDITEDIFRRGLESHVPPYETLRPSIEEQLNRLRRTLLYYQAQMDQAPTLISQYLKFFNGLTLSIRRTINDVRRLRYAITTSQLGDECPLLHIQVQDGLDLEADGTSSMLTGQDQVCPAPLRITDGATEDNADVVSSSGYSAADEPVSQLERRRTPFVPPTHNAEHPDSNRLRGACGRRSRSSAFSGRLTEHGSLILKVVIKSTFRLAVESVAARLRTVFNLASLSHDPQCPPSSPTPQFRREYELMCSYIRAMRERDDFERGKNGVWLLEDRER